MLKLAEQQFGTGARYEAPDEKTFTYFGVGAGAIDWDLGRDIRNILAYIRGVKAFNWPVVDFSSDGGYKQALDKLKTTGTPRFEPPTKNQGSSLSCVPQSGCWYQECKNCLETGEWIELSPHDVYPKIRLAFGGSHINYFFEHKNTIGVAPEALVTSYDNGNPPDESFIRKEVKLGPITEIERFIAKGKEYRQIVHYNDIEKIAQAIRDFYVLASGVTGSNNGTWFSEYPEPPIAGVPIWLHAITIGGYGRDSISKFILIKNTWGEGCGVGGWQKLRPSYITGGFLFNIHMDTDLENVPEQQRPFELAQEWLKNNWQKVRDAHPEVYIGSYYHQIVWKYMQTALDLGDYNQRDYYNYAQFLQRKV